jgi:hypothetical protein
VGDLLFPVDRPDLIDGVVDGWTEPPVHTENGLIDYGGKGEVIKYIGTVAPQIQ